MQFWYGRWTQIRNNDHFFLLCNWCGKSRWWCHLFNSYFISVPKATRGKIWQMTVKKKLHLEKYSFTVITQKILNNVQHYIINTGILKLFSRVAHLELKKQWESTWSTFPENDIKICSYTSNFFVYRRMNAGCHMTSMAEVITVCHQIGFEIWRSTN